MTAEELRSLADEATPGPWKANADHVLAAEPDAIGRFLLGRNARLAALAPDLARLCAELGEALEAVLMTDEGGRAPYPEIAAASTALAKLSELKP